MPMPACPAPLRRGLALALLTVASGHPLTAQGTPTPLRDHLEPARLEARRDSFVVVLNGAPKGWQVLSAARDGAGWTVGDAISIDGLVSQSSVIRLDAQLRELSLRQEGLMRAMPMRIALDLRDGRATGTALTPSAPAGEVRIDVPIADGVVDDNAVTPLLSAVRWRDSLSLTIPVLTSGKGTIAPFTLRGVGRERVTVPAGAFDTWRVELQMERARVIVNVTTAVPYRVVRLQNGPAFDVQLVH